MNELIKIEQNEDGIKTVNARELHEFLESKTKFSDWIKRRIEKYDFIENEDFIKVSQKRDTLGGIQNSVSFYISVSMAKEISMVENNDKGKEARIYFIRMEKKAKTKKLVPKTYGEALIEAGRLAIENDKLLIENTTMKPKADFYDTVTGSSDTIDMRQASGVLDFPGYGRGNLFQFLRDKKILDSKNHPYRQYQDIGYFRMIETEFTDSYGETHINIKTVVYQKGLDFIRKLLEENQIIDYHDYDNRDYAGTFLN